MNINRRFLAQSFLTIGAVLRTFDPAPPKQFTDYESQIKAEADVQGNNPKENKPKKPRFPFGRGRQRRPYIQFEDGSYKIL